MNIYAKRKSIPKKMRELVHAKCDGKCAYCGAVLKKGWHVDHAIPVAFWHRFASGLPYKVDDIENLLPSCPSCNNYKRGETLEVFRDELGRQLERLNRYSCNYRFAKRYGQVQETPTSIVFYFERADETADLPITLKITETK